MKVLAVIFFLLASFLLVNPSKAIAQTEEEIIPITTTPVPATSTAEIEYNLAYPGILPDNPLYFLKATRDRIVSFLINDPVKRAEFDLLTSDKRIYSAVLLLEKKKEELAVSTLSKSNNYMDQAIVAVSEAKKQGRVYDTVLSNLELSIKKHKELTRDLEKKISKDFKGQVRQEGKRLENFGKNVEKLRPN